MIPVHIGEDAHLVVFGTSCLEDVLQVDLVVPFSNVVFKDHWESLFEFVSDIPPHVLSLPLQECALGSSQAALNEISEASNRLIWRAFDQVLHQLRFSNGTGLSLPLPLQRTFELDVAPLAGLDGLFDELCRDIDGTPISCFDGLLDVH